MRDALQDFAAADPGIRGIQEVPMRISELEAEPPIQHQQLMLTVAGVMVTIVTLVMGAES